MGSRSAADICRRLEPPRYAVRRRSSTKRNWPRMLAVAASLGNARRTKPVVLVAITASCCFPWDSHGSLPVLLISGTPKHSSDAVLRAGVVATGRTSSSDSDFDNLSGTVVELRGFEPLASSLRTRRSPN